MSIVSVSGSQRPCGEEPNIISSSKYQLVVARVSDAGGKIVSAPHRRTFAYEPTTVSFAVYGAL